MQLRDKTGTCYETVCGDEKLDHKNEGGNSDFAFAYGRGGAHVRRPTAVAVPTAPMKSVVKRADPMREHPKKAPRARESPKKSFSHEATPESCCCFIYSHCSVIV